MLFSAFLDLFGVYSGHFLVGCGDDLVYRNLFELTELRHVRKRVGGVFEKADADNLDWDE